MPKLGKLEKVNLREIWANEEYDFSVWLSKEDFDTFERIMKERNNIG